MMTPGDIDKLQKENYKLKQKIEEYQEALLNICSNQGGVLSGRM